MGCRGDNTTWQRFQRYERTMSSTDFEQTVGLPVSQNVVTHVM